MRKKILIGIGIVLGFFILIGIIGSNSSNPQTLSPTASSKESIVGESVYTKDTNKEIIPKVTPTATPIQNSGLSNDDTYVNSQGNTVHSPAYSNNVPAGATAICGDGTYSFSQSRRGTCSHHGGVSQWL